MNADIANCNQIMLSVIVINSHYRIIPMKFGAVLTDKNFETV